MLGRFGQEAPGDSVSSQKALDHECMRMRHLHTIADNRNRPVFVQEKEAKPELKGYNRRSWMNWLTGSLPFNFWKVNALNPLFASTW